METTREEAPKPAILVVEDEPVLRDGLVDLLRGSGHDVDAAADGGSALRRLAERPFSIVLLDRRLPDGEGLLLCPEIRRLRPGVLILMLTSRASEDEKVDGLRGGADDYVTKPFSSRELLARIEALARRLPPRGPERIESGGIRIDFEKLLLERGGDPIRLTAKEAAILRFLHGNRGKSVSRSELLESVWGLRPDLETRTVDATIANLRKKIERDPARPTIVVSVRGLGYTWGLPEPPG